LSGGGTIQPNNPRPGGIVNNMFTLIIDPKRLVEQTWLNQELDEMVTYLKNTPAQAETGPVKIAGEPERATRQDRQQNGIPVAEWEGIKQAGVELGLSKDRLEQLIRE
jgi:uncharacterized oxidoreductase